jgi:hypothetical protein
MTGNIDSKKSNTSKLKTELKGIESESSSMKKQFDEQSSKLKVSAHG